MPTQTRRRLRSSPQSQIPNPDPLPFSLFALHSSLSSPCPPCLRGESIQFPDPPSFPQNRPSPPHLPFFPPIPSLFTTLSAPSFPATSAPPFRGRSTHA